VRITALQSHIAASPSALAPGELAAHNGKFASGVRDEDEGERRVEAFVASASMASAHASFLVRALPVFAPSSLSSASWRSPTTRRVSSGVRADQAARPAVVARDRAIGERVVRLLLVAVPLHDEQLRFDVGALVARHHRIGHRPDDVPDLAPDLENGRPRARGCFPPMIDL
jgi:hypothetical protein